MKVDNITREEVQLGDKIIYRVDGHKKTKFIGRLDDIPINGKILSIERPTTFGIVAETNDIDEEILYEEEKIYLKKILDSELLNDVEIISIFFSKHDYYVNIEFYSKEYTELQIICRNYQFNGIPCYAEYTLEELGL